jgi:hypothetical protein
MDSFLLSSKSHLLHVFFEASRAMAKSLIQGVTGVGMDDECYVG